MTLPPFMPVPLAHRTLVRLPAMFRPLLLLVAAVLAVNALIVPADLARARQVPGQQPSVLSARTPGNTSARARADRSIAALPRPADLGLVDGQVLQTTTPNTITLRGPMSGRLRDITFDRKQPNTVWALFDDGGGVTRSGMGLVKSTDGGATWSVFFRKEHTGLSFRSYIEVDPTNSKILYADGYKSLDGGQNWLQANSGLVGIPQDFWVAPTSPQTLYARTNDSLSKSTDGGASWQAFAAPQTELSGMVGDPLDSKKLYVYTNSIYKGCGLTYPPGAPKTTCLFMTRDGGATWTNIAPFAGAVEQADCYATPLSVVVVGPTIYVASRPNPSYGCLEKTYGVFRSQDGGATWQQVSSGLPVSAGPGGRYTDYVQIAAAEPVSGSTNDPNTLYVVGAQYDVPLQNGYEAYTPRHTLYVTKNGGTSWQAVAPVAANSSFFTQIRDVAVRAGSTVGSAQVLAVVEQRIRQTGAVADFASGVFRSVNNGTSWQKSDTGLSNQQFEWTVRGPDGLYAYLTDVGVFKSVDGGVTWRLFSTYLTENKIRVNTIVWNPTSPRTIYVGTSDGYSYGTPRGILSSTDGGATWQPRNLGIGANDARMLAIARTTPQTLFATVGNTLKRSTDGGGSWFDIAGAPTGIVNIHPHPTQSRTLYLQANNGGGGATFNLYKSTDAGTSWTHIGDNADIFAIDTSNPERLYKSSGPASNANASREGIDISDDGGATWRTVGGASYGVGRRLGGVLPTKPTILIGIVREATGLSFVPTRMEWSNDQGENWRPLANFAPDAIVPAPPVNNTATFYMPGGTFLLGKTTRIIRGEPMEVTVQDRRAGMWSYTFGPIPTEPPVVPVAQLSAESYSVAEGAAGLDITVKLSGAPEVPATVDYATADRTAQAGSDYTATSGTLTFEPGQTTGTFRVPIADDKTTENHETFTVELRNPRKAILGEASLAIVTIQGTGDPPTAGFSAATYSVEEHATEATIAVVLSAAPVAQTTVNYVTEDGSATAGTDYSPASGILTFAPGERSKTFAVPIVTDLLLEQNETITLRLADPTNAQLGGRNTAILTIMDSGPAPTVCFDAASYTTDERAGTATLRVILSAPPRLDASVTYSTEDGTASYEDYAPSADYLTFAPGEISKTLTVQIYEDMTPESDETVILRLSNPTNLLMGAPTTATLTIAGQQTQSNTVYLPLVMRGASGHATQSGPRAALAQPAAVTSCGGPPAPINPEPPRPASVKTTISNVPGAATLVRLAVTAPDLAAPITKDVIPSGGTAKADLSVPAGRGRVITAVAQGRAGVLARVTRIADIESAVAATIGLTFPAVPPSVTCAAVKLSATRAAPGKVLDLTGVSLPADAKVNLIASGVALPAFVDTTGIHFSLPPVSALPVGARAGLSLIVNDVLVPCVLPSVEMLALPPAPGEHQRVLGEMIGLVDDIAVALTDLEATTGVQPEQQQVMARLRDALQQRASTITITAELEQADALLAQAGLLGQLRELRASLAVPPVEPAAAAALTALAPRPLAEIAVVPQFANARQVLEENRRLELIRTGLGQPAFKIFKQNLGFYLFGVGLAFPAAGPALSLLGIGMYTLDTVVNFLHSGRYLVTRIDATPPGDQVQVELIGGGPAVEWAGGMIDVQRDDVTIDSLTLAEGLASLLFPFAQGGRVLADEGLRDIVNLFFVDIFSRLSFVERDATDPGVWKMQPGPQTSVPLDDLASATVVPEGKARVKTGNPGLIQGCATEGTAAIHLRVAELEWVEDATERQATLGLFFRAPDANTAPGGALCGGFASVAGGSQHSLAVKRDGTLWAWGANRFGQLGDGTTTDRLDPVQVVGVTNVVTVVAGLDFSLAIDGNGDLWSWGRNGDGQVGDGSLATRLKPKLILHNAVAVAAGERHALAVTRGGTVYAWGHNGYGQLGLSTGAPRRVVSPTAVPLLRHFVGVAAGRTHSLALKSNGWVYAMGYNAFGQLGDGTTKDSSVAGEVIMLRDVVAIAAGGLHSLALRGDGTVFAWGWNDHAQLGFGPTQAKTFPIRLTGISDVRAISAGNVHSVALGGNYQVYAWGGNSAGQVNGNPSGYVAQPVEVVFAAQSTRIEAGSYYTAAMDVRGRALAWGQNTYGQLGAGNRSTVTGFVTMRE